MGGTGLSDVDERALESYLMSIPPFDNGRIEPDGTPVEPVTMSARRGAAVFQRARCGECHRPPTYTHTSLFNVGTEGSWSVPTLRNVSRQSRLAHDGRWPDLEAAVKASLARAEVELTPRETRQLLNYLRLF